MQIGRKQRKRFLLGNDIQKFIFVRGLTLGVSFTRHDSSVRELPLPLRLERCWQDVLQIPGKCAREADKFFIYIYTGWWQARQRAVRNANIYILWH